MRNVIHCIYIYRYKLALSKKTHSLAQSVFVSWGQKRADDVGTLAFDMARCANSHWANEKTAHHGPVVLTCWYFIDSIRIC